MSEENVELTLLMSDAFNRRDVEAVVALWDEEGVWYPAMEALTEGRRTTGSRSTWVAARVGDTPATVLSTYAHLLPQSDEIAAERVAVALAA